MSKRADSRRATWRTMDTFDTLAAEPYENRPAWGEPDGGQERERRDGNDGDDVVDQGRTEDERMSGRE